MTQFRSKSSSNRSSGSNMNQRHFCYTSVAVVVAVVLSSVVPVSASSSSSGSNNNALGFQYNDVAECSNSIIEIDYLSFICGDDNDNECTTGSDVTITGQFTSTLPVPDEVNVKIQVCKMWGYLCTPYLVERDINFCDEIGITNDNDDDEEGTDDYDADYYCASAGTYAFGTTSPVTIPTFSIMNNFATNGMTFRIYLTLNDEINCYGSFTTTRTVIEEQASTANAQLSYSLLGVAAILLSIFSIQEMRKRKLQHTSSFSSSSSSLSSSNTRRNRKGGDRRTRIGKIDLQRIEEEEEDEIEIAHSSSSSGSSHHHQYNMYHAQESSPRFSPPTIDFDAMQDHYVTL